MTAITAGTLIPGYEPVAEAFERNFVEHGELGAAFAAVVAGRLVVDIWGGVADRRTQRPWDENTLQVIFSGTKGLVAVCLLLLIDRDRLELDAPVCSYWPEFGAGGKQDVTVRQVVSHTASLPGISVSVGVEEITEPVRMASLLAEQRRFEDPRARNAYHALTYGWLCGELIRRIDGRSVGRFFAEEIAAPLDLDIYIGLPPNLEQRVSQLTMADGWDSVGGLDGTGDELLTSMMANPITLTPDALPRTWNSSTYHEAEIPAAGGIATARSMARLYGGLGQLVTRETLATATTELARRQDPVLDEPHAFGIGFELQTSLRPFGPPADGFGHTGAGGSVHGRWPSLDAGVSYAMNLMRNDYPHGDPRPAKLLEALYDCIADAGESSDAGGVPGGSPNATGDISGRAGSAGSGGLAAS
jgi:CubicO group peptidase (beta-lactamase class C family)